MGREKKKIWVDRGDRWPYYQCKRPNEKKGRLCWFLINGQTATVEKPCHLVYFREIFHQVWVNTVHARNKKNIANSWPK